MHRVLKSRAEMLRRVAEITAELQGARIELQEQRRTTGDPTTGQVVLRAAQLSRERARLERYLYELRLDRDAAAAFPPTESNDRT